MHDRFLSFFSVSVLFIFLGLNPTLLESRPPSQSSTPSKKVDIPIVLKNKKIKPDVDRKAKTEQQSSPSEKNELLTEVTPPRSSPLNPAQQEEPPPPEPKPYVAGIETYGSSRIHIGLVKKLLGKDLERWVEMGLSGNPKASELERNLTQRIQTKWDFATVDWSIIQYFEGELLPIFITLDVVEKTDVARRMPFKQWPQQEFKDPDQLIRSWSEYESLALNLVEQGEIEPDSETCKSAFHCPFGHTHPKLKKYEKIFEDGVKKHWNSLSRILTEDKRWEWRANAAFLLAYHKEGKKVVEWMVDRIKDPDFEVRNNALRVLGDIAEFYPQIPIPIQPILEALHFPRVAERSKALFVLYLCTLNSQNSHSLILESVPTLIELMQSVQPDHKDLAHGILRKISGKSFKSSEISSWKKWYENLPSRQISTK